MPDKNRDIVIGSRPELFAGDRSRIARAASCDLDENHRQGGTLQPSMRSPDSHRLHFPRQGIVHTRSPTSGRDRPLPYRLTIGSTEAGIEEVRYRAAQASMVGMADTSVLADRTHRYGAPVDVISRALTHDRHRWLVLNPGEELPRILVHEGRRIVWSSFWPVSPSDTIEFDLSRYGGGCAVHFRWLTAAPPDERGIAFTRQRLNRKLGGDLRGWLAGDEAWRGADL